MSGYHELRDIAARIARTAGDFAAAERRKGVHAIGSKSSIVDVVTQVDRDAEAMIGELLTSARPGDGLLGEEGLSAEGNSGVTWVVDPIDGTVNFLYGIPHYAVSIAAVEGPPEPGKWTIVAGAVYNPSLDELFTAHLGGGAHLGSTPLKVSDPVPLEEALWLTGFAYSASTGAFRHSSCCRCSQKFAIFGEWEQRLSTSPRLPRDAGISILNGH